MKDFWHDAWRVIGLFVIGVFILKISPPIAALLNEPYLATFGMFAAFALLGIAAGHVARRLLFPRVGMSRLAVSASQDPRSAGHVFLGVCIVLAALVLALRPVQAAEPPAAAAALLPVLLSEQRMYWPDMPAPSVLAAQVEQETCIHLQHRSCWNPRAELKTSREYGFGLGQVTVTSRFNVHDELRAAYPALGGWTWDNRFDARYQLRALVLKDRQNWRVHAQAADDSERLAFALAGYNGGNGGVAADRKLCASLPDCDPSRWFGHVERHSYKAKLAVAGYGKSFFEINREYVRNIFFVRRDRYRAAMGES